MDFEIETIKKNTSTMRVNPSKNSDLKKESSKITSTTKHTYLDDLDISYKAFVLYVIVFSYLPSHK